MTDSTDIGTPSSPLVAALLARTGGTPTLPANSRYQGLPTRTWNGPDGTTIAYLSRRLVPQASCFAAVGTYRMAWGDRLDQVAGAKYGDPLLAWRLADANGTLDPAELERRGAIIRIVLPAGIPGNSGA